MATRRWLGKAAQIKEIKTITVGGTWIAAETSIISVGNVDITITIGTPVTTSDVATLIKEAINGETASGASASYTPSGGGPSIPEFAEFTATVSTNVVTVTMTTAGEPFDLTKDTTGSAAGTLTIATTQSATGKHFWNNVDNWSGNTVPVNGDTVVFDSGNVDCKHALTTSIQPAVYIQTMGYTGRIGLREVNQDNASKTYNEYRTPKYLTFTNDAGTAACAVTIGQGDGTGSQLTRLDFGSSTALTIDVFNNSSRLDVNIPAILILTADTAAVLNVYKGDVGVAFFDGETSHLNRVRCLYRDNILGDSTVVIGDGVDIDNCTMEQSGGNLSVEGTMNTSPAIIEQDDGVLHVNGSGDTYLKIVNRGGTLEFNALSTITDLELSGTLDATANPGGTVTTGKLYSGAAVQDPVRRVTWTNPIQLVGCAYNEVDINFGKHFRLAPTEIP